MINNSINNNKVTDKEEKDRKTKEYDPNIFEVYNRQIVYKTDKLTPEKRKDLIQGFIQSVLNKETHSVEQQEIISNFARSLFDQFLESETGKCFRFPRDYPTPSDIGTATFGILMHKVIDNLCFEILPPLTDKLEEKKEKISKQYHSEDGKWKVSKKNQNQSSEKNISNDFSSEEGDRKLKLSQASSSKNQKPMRKSNNNENKAYNITNCHAHKKKLLEYKSDTDFDLDSEIVYARIISSNIISILEKFLQDKRRRNIYHFVYNQLFLANQILHCLGYELNQKCDPIIIEAILDQLNTCPHLKLKFPEDPDSSSEFVFETFFLLRNNSEYNMALWNSKDFNSPHQNDSNYLCNSHITSNIIQNFQVENLASCIDSFEDAKWTAENDNFLLIYARKFKFNWKKIAKKFKNPSFPPKFLIERFKRLKNLVSNKKTSFTLQEDQKIELYHKIFGINWKKIANNFPNRTPNEIKNRFNYLKYMKRMNESNCNDTASEDELTQNYYMTDGPSTSNARTDQDYSKQYQFERFTIHRFDNLEYEQVIGRSSFRNSNHENILDLLESSKIFSTQFESQYNLIDDNSLKKNGFEEKRSPFLFEFTSDPNRTSAMIRKGFSEIQNLLPDIHPTMVRNRSYHVNKMKRMIESNSKVIDAEDGSSSHVEEDCYKTDGPTTSDARTDHNHSNQYQFDLNFEVPLDTTHHLDLEHGHEHQKSDDQLESSKRCDLNGFELENYKIDDFEFEKIDFFKLEDQNLLESFSNIYMQFQKIHPK